jgi:ClpP class serine protease
LNKKITKYAISSLVADTVWCVDFNWLQSFLSAIEHSDIMSLQLKESKRVGFNTSVRENVGIIELSGPIFYRSNFLTEILGIGGALQSISKEVYLLSENEDVTEFVMTVDSPGGTVTGVNEFADLIKRVGEKKPVSAYVGGTSASAGYWITSAANEIVVSPTARLGSIGVVKTIYPDGDDDGGVVEIVSSASPYKRPDIKTKDGRADQQREVDELAEVFINTVAKNRNVSPSVVISEFGAGGILVGENAVKSGMADRIGYFEDILSQKTGGGSNSTPGINANADNFKTVVQGENIMNLSELKAAHPELYKEVYEAGVAEGKKGDSVVDPSDLIKKDEEIASLKQTLGAQAEQLSSLEKRETIRAEKELAATAKSIETALLATSDIPKRLYPKVEGRVDFNAHVENGVLNVETFEKAISAEIKDWEDSLEAVTPKVQGFSTGGADPSVGDKSKNQSDIDNCVERMLGYVTIPE